MGCDYFADADGTIEFTNKISDETLSIVDLEPNQPLYLSDDDRLDDPRSADGDEWELTKGRIR